ncbi:extracellular solute-binding protein [Paenibacillus sp. GCM10023252]|uniref:extracellular solute-binding protein n=1 Tax=Paenibacillus sp. GCM10023252 TaxID=3252649 RepID=UPI003612410F
MKKGLQAAIGTAVLITSLLSGCASGNSNEEKEHTASKDAGPTEISLMAINTGAEAPKDDNAIELEMEKRTNTKLNIKYIPSNNYGDKFKVTIASGDIPDVMLTTWIYDPVVMQAIREGAFWDLTPYLKDYPNLMNTYPKESWDNTRIDGKNYGIPRPRPLAGGVAFPALRKDWMDKLGLSTPKTMDELYTVLKAFTENDPDGNGKKDTVGFAASVGEGWMDKLAFVEDVFAGDQNGTFIKDGKMEFRDFQPSERDALLWLQKAYKEGVLATDFAVMKETQVYDMMKAGQIGMAPRSMDSAAIWDAISTLRKTSPNADIIHLPWITSPATGKPFVHKEGGFFGNYLISKKVPEAKMKKILEFFDYGASKEGMDLAKYGLEGVHHTVEGGIKTQNEEYKKIPGGQLVGIWSFVDKYSRVLPAGGSPMEMTERDKKVVDERLKVGTFINMSGVNSETETQHWTEIAKKIQDMKIKVIMGKETIEEWDKMVISLKEDPRMNNILEERYDSYRKLYGN